MSVVAALVEGASITLIAARFAILLVAGLNCLRAHPTQDSSIKAMADGFSKGRALGPTSEGFG